MKAGICLSAMLITLVLAGCASHPPLATVPNVDLQRYAGRWFEIAKYPNWFQAGCVGDISAEYTPQQDGRVEVVNRCRQKNGTFREVRGYATIVPGSHGSRLRVRFAGSPVAGDYWIIGLDEKNYSWALVGDPSRQFLWILGRRPQMSAGAYSRIVALAAKLGYSEERIKATAHTSNL